MTKAGFIKIWRSMADDPLWTSVPHAWFRVAMGVLFKANWKPGKWWDGSREVQIPAGGLVTSEDKLAGFCRVSRQQCRGAFRYFQETQWAKVETTSRHTLLIVRNWGRYQGDTRDRQPADDQPDNQPITTIEEGKKSSSRKQEQKAVRLRPKSPVICGETGATETASFSVEVDDEKSQRQPGATPEAEFKLRIVERHGETVDAERVLLDVKKKLDEGQVDLAEFLERDLTATTGKLSNPHGYYRVLAKRIVNEHKAKVDAFVLGLQMAARAPVPSPPVVKLCDLCADGLLPGGGCCTCKVGDFRRQMDEHAKQKRTAA
jgi:hypothetical protein